MWLVYIPNHATWTTFNIFIFFCTSVYLFLFPFTILFYLLIIHAMLCKRSKNVSRMFNIVRIYCVHILDIVMNLPIWHGLPTRAVQIVHLPCLIIVTTMIKGIWRLITLQWATTLQYWRTPLEPIQWNMLSTFCVFCNFTMLEINCNL